jgi:Cu/Ag efflux pump CusA
VACGNERIRRYRARYHAAKLDGISMLQRFREGGGTAHVLLLTAREALVQSGRRRLRPVLMTSLAAALGLDLPADARCSLTR